jgi:O-antigen/teichoic acid export membrane protein
MSDALLTMPPIDRPPNLKRRVLRAGAWVMGSHVGVQLLRLAGSLVMTRLLVPDMFGVMAIAYVFMTGLSMFSDIGLGQSIVQSRRGEDPAFLNTAWTLQILRGLLLAALAVGVAAVLHVLKAAGALPAGSVYADPMLPPVISGLALTALIIGFESNRLAIARRQLNMGRVARLDIAGQAVSLVVMVLWARVDPSVWALVAGAIVSTSVRVVLSHTVLPGPPDRLAWDRSALSELIGFGKWVFLSSILGFLLMNGDRLILGGLVGADLLGLYSVAFMMAGVLQQVGMKLMPTVALPALSEIAREAPDRLRRSYYRIRVPLDIVTLVFAGGLFVSGTTIVGLVYDPRYIGAGPILEVLAVGLVAARYDVAEQCFLALGRPKLLGILNGIRVTAVYVGIPLAFAWRGFDAALWAVVAAPALAVPAMILMKHRLGLLDVRKEVVVLPALLVGMLLGYGFSRMFAW